MYRKITVTTPTRSTCDAQAVFMLSGADGSNRWIDETNAAVSDDAVVAAIARPEFNAGRGRVTTVYPTGGPGRVFIVGLGDEAKLDGEAWRIAGAKLVAAAFASRVVSLGLTLNPGWLDRLDVDADAAAGALGDGMAIAGFSFEDYKGTAGSLEKPGKPIDLSVRVAGSLCKGFGRALEIGHGVTTARRLAATPPNVANPRYIVAECRKLAKRVGLKCSVFNAQRIRELGMGGITAVGQGGSTPPALICLEWEGRRKTRSTKSQTGKKIKLETQRPLLLVGKAVTFDTGGYSLKVGGSMKGMKYDKCGGMTVIGAMEAIARLKLKQRVVALIPCVENMIDEKAYRVDDIVTFYNGVTAEITNTDAEGRLILADALAYGTKKYKPAAVVDLATLTGGVVVALGSYCAGVFCNDTELHQRLFAAGDATGDRLWRLPLWDEHRKLMRGRHADLLNSAPVREAHPIQGAAFLSYFVGQNAPQAMPTVPWAHLDIAGVASLDRESPLYPVGPTGFGVRLLTRLVMDWK